MCSHGCCFLFIRENHRGRTPNIEPTSETKKKKLQKKTKERKIKLKRKKENYKVPTVQQKDFHVIELNNIWAN